MTDLHRTSPRERAKARNALARHNFASSSKWPVEFCGLFASFQALFSPNKLVSALLYSGRNKRHMASPLNWRPATKHDAKCAVKLLASAAIDSSACLPVALTLRQTLLLGALSNALKLAQTFLLPTSSSDVKC